MVKYTQTIRQQFADKLSECVWPFCGVGASKVKSMTRSRMRLWSLIQHNSSNSKGDISLTAIKDDIILIDSFHLKFRTDKASVHQWSVPFFVVSAIW